MPGPRLVGLLISIQALFSNIGFEASDSGFIKGKIYYKIRKEGRMSPKLLESSGLENYSPNHLITLQDSGNPPYLYVFDKSNLRITDSLKTRLINEDWETLASDDKGNIFIGDIGNNSNKRKDLTIYKLSSTDTSEITMSYQDQKEFPPTINRKNFDCEAMIWYADSLHFYSKNRGEKWVKHYAIPDRPGKYSAKPLDSIYLEKQITGADFNVSTNTLYLLGYGMIYTFKSPTLKIPEYGIRFTRSGQAEAIFSSGDTTYITNESGKVFRMTRK